MDKIKNGLIAPGDLEISQIERAETIPSHWYTSGEILEFEQEVLFTSFWQLAGHHSQLEKPGDVITFEVAGNPIMAVRDKEQIRVFYNVCRHRGGPVAVKKGTTSVLQCQYHGWTYRLDGTLRGVPQFNKVDLFDKSDFGLVPVPFDTWQGLVFVTLNENSPKLKSFIDGIHNQISPIDLANFKYHKRQNYKMDCNWKVYVDNFLEGYHIPIVHPDLANLLDYREYVTEIHPWYSLQYSPFKNKSGDNIYKAEEGKAYYYFIFPNIMLNILPGRLQTNIVRPLGPGKCEVVFNYYYSDIESDEALEMIQEDIEYSHKIQLEDIQICESVQKGLQSKAYDKGRFSVEREQGVFHFQSLLKKVFGERLKGHT